MTAIALEGRRSRSRRHRPSLRRRLLLFLTIPVLTALLLDAILTYVVALAYANHVHDVDLTDDAVTVAQMLKARFPGETVSAQARFLLEYDPDGRDYFALSSTRHGLIGGSRGLALAERQAHRTPSPALFDLRLHGRPLRAASITLANPADPGDTLHISIAEDLEARRLQARQILMLAVPLQILLITVILLLVWVGVNVGLRVLEPLTRQVGSRGHDLTPLAQHEVPTELLPLTSTINGLFSRLRELMSLHQRFIADAAHQLRTPLAGLALHVEQALSDPPPPVPELRGALLHIRRLTARAARTSNQLLALTRAQTPGAEAGPYAPLDLRVLVSEVIENRLHDAWRSEVDLGFDGPEGPLRMRGDAAALRELMDNLMDNALCYAGRGGTVTATLAVRDDGTVELGVEDDGPGVDDAHLPHLGERFFRVPGSPEGGTGLGLAIVRQIAEHHGACVTFARAGKRGLRVTVHFPRPDVHA